MSLLAAMNTMKTTSQQLNIQRSINGDGQGQGVGILKSGHDAMNQSLPVMLNVSASYQKVPICRAQFNNTVTFTSLFFQFDRQDPDQLYNDWVKNIDVNQQAENEVLSKLMASDISTADFTNTFIEYAKQPVASNANVDVIMAENGNDAGNTLDEQSVESQEEDHTNPQVEEVKRLI